jgi:hypothetical protein
MVLACKESMVLHSGSAVLAAIIEKFVYLGLLLTNALAYLLAGSVRRQKVFIKLTLEIPIKKKLSLVWIGQ